MTDPVGKERFLGRLTRRLGRPRPRDVKPPEWTREPWDHLHEGESREERIRRFCENLVAAGAEGCRVANAVELREQLWQDLHREQVRHLVRWEDEQLAGLVRGADLAVETVWEDGIPGDVRTREAERADVGLVRAEWGLAFTGTVVLWNDRGRGRSVSLLPPILLIILPEDRIVSRMAPVLQWIRAQPDVPSCINFITGPSRTSDIENDLSIGVHGPGKVKVYILEHEG